MININGTDNIKSINIYNDILVIEKNDGSSYDLRIIRTIIKEQNLSIHFFNENDVLIIDNTWKIKDYKTLFNKLKMNIEQFRFGNVVSEIIPIDNLKLIINTMEVLPLVEKILEQKLL